MQEGLQKTHILTECDRYFGCLLLNGLFVILKGRVTGSQVLKFSPVGNL